MSSHLIVGTAGHIDHGKTTLLRHLTGVNLDSTPEEQKRGITISLGFTSLQLPSGRLISLIDVPGHEKLIKTMIAGATGLDAVLLCISATDSVMPQTKEHFEILKLLDIQHGVIVLTMCDLADEEDIELITEEISELVDGSFLENAPIIQTSCATNPFGLEEVKQALEAIPSINRIDQGFFRLPIDRVFTQKGFGTVVTGTSRGGELMEGSIVSILPQGLEAKVRNIQVHSRQQSIAPAHQRVALNLSGISHSALSRGDCIILKDSLPMSSMLDVQYHHIESAPTISNRSKVRVLFGSSEILATVHIISKEETIEEAGNYFIQLRLETPQVFLKGDLLILRRESPLETLGGGKILDPFPPKIRTKNREEQLAFIKKLSKGEHDAFFSRRKLQGLPSSQAQFLGLEKDFSHLKLGEIYFAPQYIQSFQKKIVSCIQNWNELYPLRKGISAIEAHHQSLPFLSKSTFLQLIDQLLEKEQILQTDKLLHHPSFQIMLLPSQEKEINKLLQALEQRGFEGLEYSEITVISKDLLQYALDVKKMIRIKSQILPTTKLKILLECLQSFFSKHSEMTTADFKEMTSLSRKYCIPLLEWLDQKGFTIRKENSRILGTLDGTKIE